MRKSTFHDAAQEDSPDAAIDALWRTDGHTAERLALIAPSVLVPMNTFDPDDDLDPAHAAALVAGRHTAPHPLGGLTVLTVYPAMATVLVHEVRADPETAPLYAATALIPVMHAFGPNGMRFRPWPVLPVERRALLLRDAALRAATAATIPDLLRAVGQSARPPAPFHRLWAGRGAALVEALVSVLDDVPAHRTLAGLGAYG